MDEERYKDLQDTEELVNLVTQWHSQIVAELEHLLDLPANNLGDTVEVTDKVTGKMTKLKLKGRTLVGLKVGIETALTAFRTLPFVEVPDIMDDDLVKLKEPTNVHTKNES